MQVQSYEEAAIEDKSATMHLVNSHWEYTPETQFLWMLGLAKAKMCPAEMAGFVRETLNTYGEQFSEDPWHRLPKSDFGYATYDTLRGCSRLRQAYLLITDAMVDIAAGKPVAHIYHGDDTPKEQQKSRGHYVCHCASCIVDFAVRAGENIGIRNTSPYYTGRETCKFFTTRAGKKENRLGERASEWGKYESAHGDFTEGFQRYVGSRNWIEFEMALAIWVAHLPFNAPEVMKVVELDSTGPLTAYTKEFMESGQDGYTQLGLRIFAACHQQITSLARFYIASADTMLETAPF